MRILIATMPFTGHVNPAQPIAAELRKRGHEVTWLTGEGCREKVEVTGATFIAQKHIPSFEDIPVKPDDGTSGLAAAVSVLRRLFVDRIAGQVADYQEILSDFPADVLLVDLCSFGASTLHDIGGPAYATLGINPLVTQDAECPAYGTGAQPPKTIIGRNWNRLSHLMANWIFFPRLTALINIERDKLSLPPLPSSGFYDTSRSKYLHIMPTTLAFEFPRNFSPNVHFVGPLLPVQSQPFETPTWWGDVVNKGETKIAHVTQGTYATNAVNLIQPTINALSSIPNLLLVVTTPDAETAFKEVGLPANVRLASFIPHSELLPYVDVMITNAGYNGVLAALCHRVPLVCAGRTEDKADVSSRVVYAEAGIDLGTDSPSEASIKNAVQDVLRTEKYRDGARRVQQSFQESRGAAQACDLLEKLGREKAVIT